MNYATVPVGIYSGVLAAACLTLVACVKQDEDRPSCPSCEIQLIEEVMMGANAGVAGAYWQLGSSWQPWVAQGKTGSWFVGPTYQRGVGSVFTERGEFTGTFGVFGSGPGEFQHVTRLYVAPAGELFVWDGELQRLSEFDANLRYVRQYTLPGMSDGEIHVGDSVIIAGLTSSGGRQRIAVIDRPTGRLIRNLGPLGGAAEPYVLAVGPHSTIVVVTRADYTVHVSRESAAAAQFKRVPAWLPKSGDNAWLNVIGAQLDHEGHLWVLVRTANAEFRAQEDLVQSAEGPVYGRADAARRVSTWLEVLDLETGRLITSRLLPSDALPVQLHNGPRVSFLAEAEDGSTVVSVLHTPLTTR